LVDLRPLSEKDRSRVDAGRSGLVAPGGSADDAAKIAAMEKRLLIRDDVGFDIADLSLSRIGQTRLPHMDRGARGTESGALADTSVSRRSRKLRPTDAHSLQSNNPQRRQKVFQRRIEAFPTPQETTCFS
jgi:hypothetical protein